MKSKMSRKKYLETKSKGDQLMSKGKYNDAIEMYTVVIERMNKANSKLGEIYMKRGLCLYRLKLFEDSIIDYQKSIDYQVNNDISLYGAGISCYNLFRFEEAVSYFKKSLKVNNRNDASMSGLGNVYRECGDYEEAISNYDAAIKLNKNNFHAYLGKGKTLFLMKKFNKSLETYKKCLIANPRFQPVYIDIGNVYRSLEKFEDAVVFFSKAIEIDNSDSMPFYCRSYCYEKLGKHEQYINDLQAALSKDK